MKSSNDPGPAPSPAEDARADQGGDPACWAHLFNDQPVADDILLADVVRQLADAIVICDTAGLIIYWNPAAARLFGWSADEVVGETLDLIIPEQFRERHWTGWNKAMSTGTTSYGERVLEVPATRRDGTRISIAFTVTLIRQGDISQPTAIVAVIRDQTEAWEKRRAANGH